MSAANAIVFVIDAAHFLHESLSDRLQWSNFDNEKFASLAICAEGVDR